MGINVIAAFLCICTNPSAVLEEEGRCMEVAVWSLYLHPLTVNHCWTRYGFYLTYYWLVLLFMQKRLEGHGIPCHLWYFRCIFYLFLNCLICKSGSYVYYIIYTAQCKGQTSKTLWSLLKALMIHGGSGCKNIAGHFVDWFKLFYNTAFKSKCIIYFYIENVRYTLSKYYFYFILLLEMFYSTTPVSLLIPPYNARRCLYFCLS